MSKNINPFKKAIYISFGSTLFVLGLIAAFIFTVLGDFELSRKIVAVSGGLLMAAFGWWLLRRGSSSIGEAIGWVLTHLIP
jgi:hypothetical protein